VSLEHFKTQVLLLHSEQSTLDRLSSGFNDRYTVHCATSGSEALNTLGETQIDIIVTAQDLPGMSGLEALREAKKRSPETVGILLAGNDDEDLEALVGEKEVFQIVRGSVTPDSLRSLIDGVARQARLLALAQSANDTTADLDEPMGEHIVMETSENGSTIISDGTGRMPRLDPKKIAAAVNIGARSVDVLVLTRDDEFLATVKESARGLHNVIYANTVSQADDAVRKQKVGVAVIDAAMVGSNVEDLTLHLRSGSPRLVSIVAGRRDDGEMLMDLINRGKVYRFLLKPVSPGRSRLAIEASVRHHLEAPDSAFQKAGKAAPMPLEKFDLVPEMKPERGPAPAARNEPAPKPAPPPAAAPKPAPVRKDEPKPARVAKLPKAHKPKPAREKPKAAEPRRPEPAAARKPEKPSPPEPRAPGIVARREEALSRLDERLGDAFGGSDTSFTETVTGLVRTVGKSFSGLRKAAKPSEPAPAPKVESAPVAPTAAGSGGSLVRNPVLLGVSAVAILAIVGLAFWLLGGPGTSVDTTPEVAANPSPARVSITEGEPELETPEPARGPMQEPLPEPAAEAADLGPDIDALLDAPRRAAEAGRIYAPEGDNAIELYMSARETLPENATVESEFSATIGKALGMAETALLENRFDDAELALRQVALVDPDNTRLPFLNAQLTQTRLRSSLDGARVAIRESRFEDAKTALDGARELAGGDTDEVKSVADELVKALSQQRVGDLLARANTRLDEGKLVAPSNDNARYYFEAALSNDPGNAAARQGLIAVASKLVLHARTQIDAGNLDAAEDLLADARNLDPASGELAAATTALQDARDRAEQERIAARKAQAEREAAAREAADREAAERAAAQKAAAEAEAADLAAAELAAAQRAAAARSGQKGTAAPPTLSASTTPAAGQSIPAARPQAAPAQSSGVSTAGSTPSDIYSPASESAPTPEPMVRNDVTEPTQQQVTFLPEAPAQAASGPQQRSTPSQDSDDPVSLSTLKRTRYVAPKYPYAAERRGISGWVDVVFTVDIDGTVRDATVSKSDPDDVFDNAAVSAVEDWEFDPILENGVAIQKRAAVRVMFTVQ
jgi:TonB family protein